MYNVRVLLLFPDNERKKKKKKAGVGGWVVLIRRVSPLFLYPIFFNFPRSFFFFSIFFSCIVNCVPRTDFLLMAKLTYKRRGPLERDPRDLLSDKHRRAGVKQRTPVIYLLRVLPPPHAPRIEFRTTNLNVLRMTESGRVRPVSMTTPYNNRHIYLMVIMFFTFFALLFTLTDKKNKGFHNKSASNRKPYVWSVLIFYILQWALCIL